MTTINDIHDLVRIVEEHPEWRGELQRLLLTKELLDTPDKITELTAVTENLANTANSLLELAESTGRHLDGIAGRFDGIDSKLEGITTDVREIHGITQTQQGDFMNFKGQFAEEVAIKRVPITTDLVGQSIGKDLEDLEVISAEQRREWVSENRDMLTSMGLERGDFISFRQSDIIILARNERDYEDTCYVAVEASYTCRPEDITRVRRNVRIIEACSETGAYGVVAGVRINDGAAAMLESRGEPTIRFFRIEEEELDT